MKDGADRRVRPRLNAQLSADGGQLDMALIDGDYTPLCSDW
jgi:hypothetical protein